MSDLDWQVLDRFLAGDASPADQELVRAWINAAPERQALVESLRRQAASAESPVDVERAWQRVAARTVRTTSVNWRRRVGWLAAAGVVLAVGSALAIRVAQTGNAPTSLAVTWREVTSPLGQRATVTLPDSSTVVLNAGSTLRYAPTFGKSEREVALTGEGYFVVKHDAARPFRVRANNASIQDVGTRFVVRAYDASHGTIVVVAEGAVGVAAEGARRDTVLVKPGMLARVATTGAITTASVDAGRYTGFSNGLLVLGDLTLDEAVPVIERWYDVKVRVADRALGKRALNADFRNEPLPSVLSALALALEVDVRYDGAARTVTISSKSGR